MDKPEGCVGCSWFQDGKGFVPDENILADVVVLMQNPGGTEVDFAKPAVGQAGKDMDYNFIPLAGLVRGETVTVSNVLKCRWNESNDLPWDDAQRQAVQHCTSRHLRVPPSTKLIIAQGKLAFEYAMGGALREEDGKVASITNWRGFLLPLEYTRPQFGETPVYCCLHTADLYHNPGMEVVTQWDWIRVRAVLDGDWPKKLPPRLLVTKDNLDEVRRWFVEARSSRWVTVDTEYIPGTSFLTVLGLLSRSIGGELEGLQLDTRTVDSAVRSEIYYHYTELIKYVPIIFHNCRADIPVLQAATGANWGDYLSYEDTMLGHAVLWCELPHTLQFVASVLGKYQKLKHLKANDELLYNFGDCLETDSIWLYLTEEGFKHDPQAEAVYRTQHLRLSPIIDATVKRGLRVNRDRVLSARTEYEAQVNQALQLANANAGWPINLNSNQQLGWYLYRLRGLPLQVNKKSGNQSIDDEAIARLRMLVGPPFDPEDDLTYDQAIERIYHGADPILEARVLYIGASTRLVKYIYSLYQVVYDVHEYNYSSNSAYKKAKDKAIEAVQSGTETAVLDRIYPDILIHSQKTGRWSYIDPPIAQLPKGLRDLIIPDAGEVWVTWDWSAIEPRILEAYCRSKILKAAFDEGIDLHTWTVCSIFGYDQPPNLKDVMGADNAEWRAKYKWKHSNDPRRVFAKTARYEMYYGGTGHNAAEAAALYGLDSKLLKRACGNLVSADPEYYKWRLEIEETIKRTRVLRTFMGRPRRFLKGGNKMVREGLDQPMQGGVSDIANTTVVLLDGLNIPGFQYAWGLHDSQYWHTSRPMVTREFLQRVKDVAARPHVINGRLTQFPIDMAVIDETGKEYSVEAYCKGQEENKGMVAQA